MAKNLQICEIDLEVKEKAKVLRFQKNPKTNAAIVLKIDPEKTLIVVDEEYTDISTDELREELPAHQPRYVLYSYIRKHDDGRVSYPLVFIFISPQGCKPELQMMYSGSKISLVNVLGATKVFELRSVEELTEEWLLEKLKFFR